MNDERALTPQPELYKCDCCENYSTTRYGLVIQLDFTDKDTKEEDGWREWPYFYAVIAIINGMKGGCQPEN